MDLHERFHNALQVIYRHSSELPLFDMWSIFPAICQMRKYIKSEMERAENKLQINLHRYYIPNVKWVTIITSEEKSK